jgi:hypothetical protein
MKKQMHEHSIKSYYEELASLPDMQARIYNAIKRMTNLKLKITDRRIKHFLELDDMNQVRPRVSELIKKGLIRETGAEHCPTTNKSVRTLDLNLYWK